jgi:hypothetical protein
VGASPNFGICDTIRAKSCICILSVLIYSNFFITGIYECIVWVCVSFRYEMHTVPTLNSYSSFKKDSIFGNSVTVSTF